MVVIVFGGLLGLLFSKQKKQRFQDTLMTEQALSNMSLTGSILIFCVGVNLIWGKKIKVANLLPAIFLAVAWTFLPVG